MIITITIKKIGNHWYPCVKHENPNDITLDKRVEKWLNILDEFQDERINISFAQQGEIIIPEGLLQFNEEDIRHYYTSSDEFPIRFYVGHHEFTLSSQLYTLLETEYNFSFAKECYRILI